MGRWNNAAGLVLPATPVPTSAATAAAAIFELINSRGMRPPRLVMPTARPFPLSPA